MPGSIPISQASPLYTMALRAKFDEMQDIKVNNFARSFFPDEICQERYPVIDVRRGSEKVAVDVIHGHQGLRQQITKSTQKAFDPFYYKLFFDATQLECYFRMFGSSSFTINQMTELVNGIAIHNKVNQDMIDRGIELHCMSVLENGTCTSLRDGSIVDFKRKAASMVTKTAGNLWTDAGVDPFADMKAAGDFLRQVGKAGGYVINAIFGIDAWQAFRNNTKVKERLTEFNNKRDVLLPAQLDSNGAIYQGEIDADTYRVRCWTYNDFYDKDNGDGTYTSTAYKNPKTVVFLPEKTTFKTLYGATPQITTKGAPTASLVAAKYVLSDFLNAEEKYHKFFIESAPLPVPITIDRIYTLQPIA